MYRHMDYIDKSRGKGIFYASLMKVERPVS